MDYACTKISNLSLKFHYRNCHQILAHEFGQKSTAGREPEHAACARACIASGLKARDGKIYVLIGKQEPPSHQVAPKRESLDAQLARYAAKIVTVRGTIIRKQGVNVIEDARVISS